MRLLALILVPVALAMGSPCAPARAQQPTTETPDRTRLDVERLPPEAVVVERDMFAHGLFLQSDFGGRGFVGGVGRLSQPGLFARVGLGYELTQWFLLGAAFELSLHDTSAPPPPSPASFQLIDTVVEARLQWPLSARATPWLGVEGGIDWTPGNLLAAYGIRRAGQADLTYGGSIGFDWHLLSRHYALGLLVGARFYPNLDTAAGERSIGIHSAACLKYVF
jgi:hypothetical protein